MTSRGKSSGHATKVAMQGGTTTLMGGGFDEHSGRSAALSLWKGSGHDGDGQTDGGELVAKSEPGLVLLVGEHRQHPEGRVGK